MTRTVQALWVLLVACCLISCEGVAMVTNAIAPEKVKAQYEIADRPTLVLVDDPHLKLGNPALADVTAARIGFDLKEEDKVKRLIDQNALAAYRSKLGDEYARRAIDRVGRDLGAQQVIYVLVEEAAVMQPGPDLFQPYARARVKLIDVSSGERLFPTPAPGAAASDGPGLSDPGHPVTVRFDQQLRGAGDLGDRAMLTRELADRLGVAVAQLFYTHLPPQPGARFER